VKFWDTSALAPLFLAEQTSDELRRVHQHDEALYIWWATPVECMSALRRLVREGVLDAQAEASARKTLTDLLASAHEVTPTQDVRLRAERLLGVHALRAADALQLAAALTWARERPQGMTVVSLDDRLRVAAQLEGFTLVPESLA